MHPGPLNLITDVSGLCVGNAQNERLKSGVTVVTADAPFVASCAIMGGAPGTRETDLLEPDRLVQEVDALVLSGGSAFGLDAASGVMTGLRKAQRGFRVGDARVPLVPAAILFDLLNGGDKSWDINPYPALGLAAFECAGKAFGIGSGGAGIGALTATLKGGLGSASAVLPNGLTVGALVAVNPTGTVTTPGERYFWAAPFELGGEFGGLGPDPRGGLGVALPRPKHAGSGERANTTIAVVATDARLTKMQAKRMAVAAHDGIGRAIVPAHMPEDGDLVFSVATGSAGVEGTDFPLLCHAAGHCLSRAIARGVYNATPASDDLLNCWRHPGI
ncbi:MAG: P1 family peptidase [Rhodobacter sp.]|nr:P1 family peptidase [Rhodobacter sp.]